MSKKNWTGFCATSVGRHQCSKENCTMFDICLIKKLHSDALKRRFSPCMTRENVKLSLEGIARNLDKNTNISIKIKPTEDTEDFGVDLFDLEVEEGHGNKKNPNRKETRLTVVHGSKRIFEKYNVKIQESIQDDGRTLKLFVDDLEEKK